MTRLSVNINKVATIRNARGGNTPNVLQVALDCERFGADGITVHPRPDERHIRFSDVDDLAANVTTEFNIEGYPTQHFIDMVVKAKPHQVTLVPDPPDVLTSNAGWDTIVHQDMLKNVIATFKAHGIRTSIFIETNNDLIKAAATTGTDRIELYTENFASEFEKGNRDSIQPYIEASRCAHGAGLGVNAGHDLNLDNLKFFADSLPYLDEVSIGHALISDALYYGLENTIQMYQRLLRS